MEKGRYPILDFDRTGIAVTEPSKLIKPKDVPEHAVFCFFSEVIRKIVKERRAKVIDKRRWETGYHFLYEIRHRGQRLAFCHPGVGAPFAAGMLEELIALGCRKFMACGGAGVLRPDIAVGHVVVPRSAVRGEGVSYHYMPPARTVSMHPDAYRATVRVLKQRRVPYIVGKTWTTDAPYRETMASVARYRREGCVTVEMEAAAFFAVARFRKVPFGQMLYAGDDVSGAEWDFRRWHKRKDVRERLFWLAADACLAF